MISLTQIEDAPSAADSQGCLREISSEELAVAAIAELLSGNEWSPDTLDAIASIVCAAGYEINDNSSQP